MGLKDGFGLSGGGNGGGGLPYKSYVALITQSGTDAPAVTAVLYNDLGATITFSRFDVGRYNATASSPVFTINKTVYSVWANSDENGRAEIGEAVPTDTVLQFSTYDGSGGSTDNEMRDGSWIEIRVYQ